MLLIRLLGRLFMNAVVERAESKLGIYGKGRVSKLDYLFDTEHGKQQYAEFLLAIENRASARSAAAFIGVHPNTLSRWLAIGKEEEGSRHRVLFDDVVLAVGKATCVAEIEANQCKPERYLQRGFARTILGNIYNVEANDNPALVANLDGTIGDATQDFDESTSLLVDEQQSALPKIEYDNKQLDQQSLIQAMLILRENGQDLNAIADAQLNEIEIEDRPDKSDESNVE